MATREERPQRTLIWEGCANVRDLGDLPTAGGGRTRRGAVIRADELRGLTPTGWAAFRDHGVSRVVDLRWDDERARDVPPPPGLGVEVLRVPVLPARDDPFWDGFPERVAHEDPVESKAAVYLAFLEGGGPAFAAAVAAVAEAPPGPVVVHCQAGKDRTGLVCALLLRLAGVSIADVALDYAESGDRLADRTRRELEAIDAPRHRERRLQEAATPTEAMRLVVERLEATHRDVGAYLAGGGASASTIEAARRRLGA